MRVVTKFQAEGARGISRGIVDDEDAPTDEAENDDNDEGKKGCQNYAEGTRVWIFVPMFSTTRGIIS